MVSGPDLITYIGIPLAVLGVLPIIYNTISTLITLANVRRMLRHGRLAGITRGDVINHVIEVELPRYTIAPLNRAEQIKEYWALSEHPSPIPGGSWTIFHWKSHAIGLKIQRLDYSDQLRQPQAEIGFEELVSFLLDLGAVPDATGFRMLRGSGLWVPIGTRLLVSPDRKESVLTIAPLDDSDGNLSLAVRWSSDWAMRDHNSLPPYWVLINGVLPRRPSSNLSSSKEAVEDDHNKSLTASAEKNLTSKYTPIPPENPPAIRCQIGSNGLTAAIPDDFDAQMFESLDIGHLSIDEDHTRTAGMWFASVITALGTSSQTIFWNYKIPSEVLTFAKRDTIPCGILVLLNIVEESKTPEWATVYNDEEEEREKQMRKMRNLTKATMNEMSMTQEERSRAFFERTSKAREDMMDEQRDKIRRGAQRAEMRVMEAIQSPKWSNKLVAEHNLTWLKKEGHVDETHQLKRATEIILWRIINEPSFAEELAAMLDAVKAFVENGGMRKAEYLELKEKQVMFAFASLVLAVIENSVSAAHGSLAMDLQECMRVWKRVRLG